QTQIINHIGSKEILSALEHEERPLALKGPKASISETPKKVVTAAVAAVTTSDHKTDSEADERHEKVRWLPAYKDSPKHRKELEKAAKKEKEKGGTSLPQVSGDVEDVAS
ncbi:unnamed protein product, partial [Ixodes persulcatus]